MNSEKGDRDVLLCVGSKELSWQEIHTWGGGGGEHKNWAFQKCHMNIAIGLRDGYLSDSRLGGRGRRIVVGV